MAAARGYTFNANLGLVKQWEGRPLQEIAEAEVGVLQGLGPVAKQLFSGFYGSTVNSVADLANWRYYRLARALVDLRDCEEKGKGKRDPRALMNINNAVVKEYETKTLHEICAAPPSILQGLSTKANKCLQSAPLYVTTIEKLANFKYARWASAIMELAEYEITDHSSIEHGREHSPEASPVRRKRLTELAKKEKDAEEKVGKLGAKGKSLEERVARLAAREKEMVERVEKLLATQEMEQREREKKLGALFDKMDANGNGVLSHNELKRFVAEKDRAARVRLGIGRWDEFVAKVDTTGSKEVSRPDFIAYFVSVDVDPELCWGGLFDAMDQNRDGRLSKSEIYAHRHCRNPRLFDLLGYTNWDDFVKAIDKDGDGEIDRQEFIRHFAKVAPQIGGAKRGRVGADGAAPAAKRARPSADGAEGAIGRAAEAISRAQDTLTQLAAKTALPKAG